MGWLFGPSEITGGFRRFQMATRILPGRWYPLVLHALGQCGLGGRCSRCSSGRRMSTPAQLLRVTGGRLIAGRQLAQQALDFQAVDCCVRRDLLDSWWRSLMTGKPSMAETFATWWSALKSQPAGSEFGGPRPRRGVSGHSLRHCAAERIPAAADRLCSPGILIGAAWRVPLWFSRGCQCSRWGQTPRTRAPGQCSADHGGLPRHWLRGGDRDAAGGSSIPDRGHDGGDGRLDCPAGTRRHGRGVGPVRCGEDSALASGRMSLLLRALLGSRPRLASSWASGPGSMGWLRRRGLGLSQGRRARGVLPQRDTLSAPLRVGSGTRAAEVFCCSGLVMGGAGRWSSRRHAPDPRNINVDCGLWRPPQWWSPAGCEKLADRAGLVAGLAAVCR